jgi:hypothetical protein
LYISLVHNKFKQCGFATTGGTYAPLASRWISFIAQSAPQTHLTEKKHHDIVAPFPTPFWTSLTRATPSSLQTPKPPEKSPLMHATSQPWCPRPDPVEEQLPEVQLLLPGRELTKGPNGWQAPKLSSDAGCIGGVGSAAPSSSGLTRPRARPVLSPLAPPLLSSRSAAPYPSALYMSPSSTPIAEPLAAHGVSALLPIHHPPPGPRDRLASKSSSRETSGSAARISHIPWRRATVGES